ncbi:MAG: ABC transporter substrate-binding protein [bacterium]
MKNIVIALVFLCSLVFCQNYPQRIISLGPYLTEEIYLLKADDNLIACTTYCKAKNKERIGSVMGVDIEKIVALKPDLVLATPLTKKDSLEKLKSLGINVVLLPYPKNFSSLCEQFMELGRLLGKERKAKAIIERSKKKINAIKERTKNFPKPSVIVQVGANPLWVAGYNTMINDFIEFAGGVNIGPKESAPYSKEEVIKNNPDVIIIMEMGIIGENEKKNWERIRVINAGKNKRIYIMDAYELGSPTPSSFAKTLKKIAKILHPRN